MAKFGLFHTYSVRPVQEYEGDYMQEDGEYVYIYIRNRNPNLLMTDPQVAVIRLDKGQSVKQIGAHTIAAGE